MIRRIIPMLLLAGCASAPVGGSDATPKQAAIFTSAETGTIMGERPRAVTAMMPQEPATVWAAVKKVYADMDVPVVVENPAAHQIGNPNFFKSRQMAGQAMSLLVDCGSGMTGPKASTYRIYMSLLTDVSGNAKGGTIVQTTFVPIGQDMAGGSSDRIPCGSTGRLELMFLDRVKAALSK